MEFEFQESISFGIYNSYIKGRTHIYHLKKKGSRKLGYFLIDIGSFIVVN